MKANVPDPQPKKGLWKIKFRADLKITNLGVLIKNVNLLILKNVSGMNSIVFTAGRKLRIIKKKIIPIENIKKVFTPKKITIVEIILSRAFWELVLIIK